MNTPAAAAPRPRWTVNTRHPTIPRMSNTLYE